MLQIVNMYCNSENYIVSGILNWWRQVRREPESYMVLGIAAGSWLEFTRLLPKR